MVLCMVRAVDPITTVAHAIADPTRRALLRLASRGERRVLELAEGCPNMTLAAVSKHLQVLERAGMIRKRRVGRDVFCRANPKPLLRLERFVRTYEKFWNARLDELEQQLRATARKKKLSA